MQFTSSKDKGYVCNVRQMTGNWIILLRRCENVDVSARIRIYAVLQAGVRIKTYVAAISAL